MRLLRASLPQREPGDGAAAGGVEPVEERVEDRGRVRVLAELEVHDGPVRPPELLEAEPLREVRVAAQRLEELEARHARGVAPELGVRLGVDLAQRNNWLTGEWATSGLRFSERFPLN